MKSYASPLLSAAILLVNSGITFSGETKPEPVPEMPQHHWELQIVDGVLVKPDATRIRIQATLRNVTDHLVELYPANVVLAPTLGEIEIGNLKLAGFRWESALEALRIASGNQFVWAIQPPTTTVDPATGMPTSPTLRDVTDLYVLEPDPAGARRAAGGVVEVFNLAGYLQDKDPAQISEALSEVLTILTESLAQVRAGGGPTEAEPKPSIRFHERARLLVLVGTAEQVDVARKIILALPGTAPSQAGMGTGYGAGAMGGGAAMGGGGFGGSGMEEAMMMRYGLRPRPQPQTEEGRAVHTVSAGDTLASIARQHGIRVDALQAANPGLDWQRLRVGQALRIPGTPPRQPGTGSGGKSIDGPPPASSPSPAGSAAVAPPAPGK